MAFRYLLVPTVLFALLSGIDALGLFATRGASSAAAAAAAGSGSASSSTANPIRKVVTLLQNMQKKVTEEGKLEEEAYHKFMCYCQTNTGELTESVESAKAKIESLDASLKQSSEAKEQTAASLAEHQTARTDAKDTIAKATALREKEARSFSEVKSEAETNLAALKKALEALEKGVFGSFLQSKAVDVVRRYALDKAELPDETRTELLSFLSNQEVAGYTPQSQEIIGILKQIEEEMTKNFDAATAEEKAAIANYEELLAAKNKELKALQTQIEEEMKRVGELGVDIATMGNEKTDTEEALTEDEKLQMELGTSCSTKTEEWEAIKATRAEELVTLAETIKVLNDDDALDLFKKTLPSTASSLLQLQVDDKADVRSKALAIIQKAKKGEKKVPSLDLLALALKGKQTGFDKVIAMIDEMVENLGKEQIEDDSKKEYCGAQIDSAEDKQKSLEVSLHDSEVLIEEAQGAIQELSEEMKALQSGIKSLDKAVAEATELRKEENSEYKELVATDSTAKDLLNWAKNRLNKFYNPKLYQPAEKRQLSEQDEISTQFGGTAPPTEAPGGIAGTGISVPTSLLQVRNTDLPAPPETFGAYTKKAEESNGVMAMIDLLIKDLDKELAESKVMEEKAQADYEATMEDSAAKRAADSKALTEKGAARAELETRLEEAHETEAATGQELRGVLKYISMLHQECDWLLKYFDARKEARSSEIESLKNAKAVLKGADYSLFQRAATSAAQHFLSSRQS